MDKKTTSNFLYNLVYQILIIIAPLFTSPYVARVLHSEGVGIYSYTSTIAMTFALFAALGVNTYGQREIAMRQQDLRARSTVFWELFVLRAVITVLVTVVYLVTCFAYQTYTVHLLQCVFIVLAIMFDISWLYQGLENFKIIVTHNILVKLATIVCIFVLVRDEGDVGIYMLINSLSAFISGIYFFLFLPKTVECIPVRQLHPLRHLKGVIQFFIPIIAVQIYSQIDKIMLGAISGNVSESGYYEQARKLANLIVVATTALNTVMLPRISNLFAGGKRKDMIKAYHETFQVTMLLLVPITTGLFLVADNFILWFLGADFAKTSLLLKWSCFLIVLMTVGNFIGMQYLAATGQQNKMTVVYLFSALINVILNALLISKLMSEGAMIASVVAEGFSCFMQVGLLKRSEFNFKMLQGVWKYVLAAAVMAVVILSINTLTGFIGMIQTFLDIVIGVVVYLMVLMLVKEDNIFRIVSKIKQYKLRNVLK